MGVCSLVVGVELLLVQLFRQILCLDTLGIMSCLCIRLLMALKVPPWVGKRKYAQESSVNWKSFSSPVILLRLNRTVVTPFSLLPKVDSVFWFESISGMTWSRSHVSMMKWRPLCSSMRPMMASELAILVELLNPIPVHLLRVLVWMINSIVSLASRYCH